MVKKITIFLEIILIFASVFIFRGLWTLLDKIPLMNNLWILLLSLVFGVIITIFVFNQLLEKHKK
jgi:uncharacterized membrane protein